VLALLGSLSYFNLINLTQTWVAGGRYGMTVAFATLHGGVFLLALALLWWRDHAAVLQFRFAAARTARA
jgi:lipopolysaccharide export system permease protein